MRKDIYNINIRGYIPDDLNELSTLFYETVHTVNGADYSDIQLFEWAKSRDSLKSRESDLKNQNTLIAEIDGKIVGFGSIDKFGYLDLLFVHKDFQRLGIATALCNALEKGFQTVTTYSSLTARQFFEKRGYVILFGQEVERNGVKLKNFKMEKRKI